MTDTIKCAECGAVVPTVAAFQSHTDDFCSVRCLQLHAVKGAKDIDWSHLDKKGEGDE